MVRCIFIALIMSVLVSCCDAMKRHMAGSPKGQDEQSLIVHSAVRSDMQEEREGEEGRSDALQHAIEELSLPNFLQLHSALSSVETALALLEILRKNENTVSHSFVLQTDVVATIRNLCLTMTAEQQTQVRTFMSTTSALHLPKLEQSPKKRMRFQIDSDMSGDDIADLLASDDDALSNETLAIFVKSKLLQMSEETDSQTAKNRFGALMCRVVLRWLRFQDMSAEDKFKFLERKIQALSKSAEVYDEYLLMLNDICFGASQDMELLNKARKAALKIYDGQTPAYKICFPVLFPMAAVTRSAVNPARYFHGVQQTVHVSSITMNLMTSTAQMIRRMRHAQTMSRFRRISGIMQIFAPFTSRFFPALSAFLEQKAYLISPAQNVAMCLLVLDAMMTLIDSYYS
ncbi:MAG: hypothetical protein K6C34_01985 [Alphaproteobacteria bacterium]|nr:hypothetical protein [Alphaproteobacteria bacterium]